MGTYIYLACRDCKQYLHIGKFQRTREDNDMTFGFLVDHLRHDIFTISEHDDTYCEVMDWKCMDKVIGEREVPPRTPSPEKEKLEGAASLESDVLFDNIQRAVKRRKKAAVDSNLIQMSPRTMNQLGPHLDARPYGKGYKHYVCDLRVQSDGRVNDGEFVISLNTRMEE